jgi:hypothetical protein
MDPTVSVSGNYMSSRSARSCRHSVGEAAALMALGKVKVAPGQDVCISSQMGSEPASFDTWEKEFERVQEMLASGSTQLFQTDFASVTSVDRLAEWLATKWAPAVLRTYDIASIRKGARPVYATRQGDTVEIVWQQLVDFKSGTTTVGKMLIQVTNEGLIAKRGPGDASKGFGTVSTKPLQGEDVLVGRLVEAASQAVDKGLATKPRQIKPEQTRKPEPEVVSVTSIQSSGTVTEQGPRQTGARRSKERARGTRKTKKEPEEES